MRCIYIYTEKASSAWPVSKISEVQITIKIVLIVMGFYQNSFIGFFSWPFVLQDWTTPEPNPYILLDWSRSIGFYWMRPYLVEACHSVV